MKTAIVTGGGGGMGVGIARALAGAGYRIGVLDHDRAQAEACASALPDAVALQADVSDEASVAAALAGFGSTPDLLVNNAGVTHKGALLDLDVARFRRVLEINLLGAFVMAKAIAPGMIARKSGVIINITSIAAITPNPNGGAYGPSKAGLANLTKVMALEFAPHGVRVNAIAPGLIDTGMGRISTVDPAIRAERVTMVPSGDLGTAEDIAKAVLFLASDDARYIHGHELVVDGAVTETVLRHLPVKKPG